MYKNIPNIPNTIGKNSTSSTSQQIRRKEQKLINGLATGNLSKKLILPNRNSYKSEVDDYYHVEEEYAYDAENNYYENLDKINKFKEIIKNLIAQKTLNSENNELCKGYDTQIKIIQDKIEKIK